jgi:hypothetical protein
MVNIFREACAVTLSLKSPGHLTQWTEDHATVCHPQGPKGKLLGVYNLRTKWTKALLFHIPAPQWRKNDQWIFGVLILLNNFKFTNN